MEVSPNELRQQTLVTLKDVNTELNMTLTPERKAMLLLAKAQCLNTLTLLRGQGNKKQ